jgi:hypothetical protein
MVWHVQCVCGVWGGFIAGGHLIPTRALICVLLCSVMFGPYDLVDND